MNGGDPILGGGQASPDNTQPINPGSQPASPAAPSVPPQPSNPAPQAPQPSASPAPIPINTSPSPDSFSSFSTQPTRPTVSSRAPVYGNSFSRPTVSRPLPPTSRPIGQPINPVSPNGIINNGQVSPYAFPPSEQMVFSNAGTASADSSGKGKKIILIVLLLLLVTGGVVAALFATGVLGGNKSTDTSSQSEAKEEIYNTLNNFNAYYDSMLSIYDDVIGLTPHFKMSDNDILFPGESTIETMSQRFREAMDLYNQNILTLPDRIESENIDLTPTKNAVGESLQSMEQNINLAQEFYKAYILPLLSNPKPTVCSKTSDMSNLDKGYTAEASGKYYVLYCNSIDFLNAHSKDIEDENTVELFKQTLNNSTVDAAATLGDLFTQATSAADNIDKLLKELLK